MKLTSSEQQRAASSRNPDEALHQARLNREERWVLRFLRERVPELAAPFVSFVPEGRRTILNRLAMSMLWEDVAGLASESYGSGVNSFEPTTDSATVGAYRQPVAESLREFGLENGTAFKILPLPGGEHLVISTIHSYAFGRFEVEGPILHVRRGSARPLQHAVELLRIVRGKEVDENGETQGPWSRFAEELSNGSANLALAYAYHQKEKERLREVALACGAETTLDLVEVLKARDEAFDAGLFFEQLCVEGHRLHPGAKTKIGMEPAAVYRYSPELEGAPDLRFVGIRRDYANWDSVEHRDTNVMLLEEYPELREAVAGPSVEGAGPSPDDYVFVPVHSWQLDQTIPDVYKDELAGGIVVPVEGVSVPSRATTSFRTLVPKAELGSRRLAAKTSVESQMTSTTRSISSNTAQNGPEFSRLIREVMRREPELAKTFVPLYETAGMCFKVDPTEKSTEAGTLKSRNLSAILRENVESFVHRGELAIVGSSLYSQSPLTGKPVLVELVERFAEGLGKTPLRRAAFRFFSEYAAMALPGFLVMMVKYGIGLEGHLQNVVPVFEGGRPVRMLFRDWGGTRLYVERLERRGLTVDLCPGSVTVASDPAEMRNKVFYTVFQNHLAEVILLVSKHLGVTEQELWQESHRICDAVFERLASNPEHAKDALEDKGALYEAEVGHKALTRMRLSEEGGDCYVAVPNPLHPFKLKSR